MRWRTIPWRRLLGWTLVLALIIGATGVLLGFLPVDRLLRGVLGHEAEYWFSWVLLIVPSLLAAFLIGRRLRERWWIAGPLLLAAPIAILGVVLLLLAATSAAGHAGPIGSGSERELLFMMGALAIGAATNFGVLHAAAAAAGVWWGKRGEEGEQQARGLDPLNDAKHRRPDERGDMAGIGSVSGAPRRERGADRGYDGAVPPTR